MFIFIFLLLLPVYILPQNGSVRGRVTENNNPIPSVNVSIQETKYGTVTDANGFYELKNLPAGLYNIRFGSVGYKAKVLGVEIFSSKISELNVSLEHTLIEINPVEIIDRKFQAQNDPRTSVIDINPRSAKILPGAAEDVLRALQSLPGVLAPSDFSSQLIVRGSGPDQNLIIMDDVEIFNPYRLYGVISMFNPEAVSDVTLITGGFPAKYGDRLSAVLDVTNREGSKKKNISGSLNASIVDANLILEGKNPFNIEGSWIVNSRRTYYDLIIGPIVKKTGLVKEDVSFPNFHDVQTKLVIGPFNGNKFLLNGIYSRDGVNVISGSKRKTPDSIGIYNSTNNDIISLAWHYVPSTKYLNKLILSWYYNSGTTDFQSQLLDPSLNRNDFENILPDTLSPYLLRFKFNSDFTFRKYSVDDKFTYAWNDKEILEAGIGVDFMQTVIDFKFDLDPELASILTSNPRSRYALNDLQDIKNYNKYRTYLQNNFLITKEIIVQPGIRMDYYDILDKFYLAPRVSLSYALDNLTTLRAVWGVFYQSPGYEKLRDQNVLFNFSKTYTETLKAEKATHYILSLERWLNSKWSIKVEGYYKDFNNLIVPKKVAGSSYFTEQISGMNPNYVSGWTRPIIVKSDSLTQIPVNNSYGEAYGLEIFLSKKNILDDDKISGWISYSLAYANRFDDGRKIPFVFDQRNTINVVVDYKINNWLQFGLRWQYGSGFPYIRPVGIKPRIILLDKNLDGIPETPVIATRSNGNNGSSSQQVIFDVDYKNNKYNDRKPAYHRLDLRISALTDFWNLNWTFYLDIINVYNRTNIIDYSYYINTNLTLGRTANTMFPIIPTLGVSIKF